MTQKDKELLLIDLCARLPYGVVVKDRNGVHKLTPTNTEFIDLFNGKCNIAPYLFPLSSMTEEQKKEWRSLMIRDSYGILYPTIDSFDYIYKNHIDFRGLISMGLANDATNLNIY